MTIISNNDGVCIENYENSDTKATSNNVQPTIIDLAPVMPSYRFCVLPYSKIMGYVIIKFVSSKWQKKQIMENVIFFRTNLLGLTK